MAKVILICGKICCGKSTYAANLRREQNAVLLSVDEIMLSLFGLYAGEKHDEYAERLQQYLLEKSAEIAMAGSSVILDWGFWTKQKRTFARAFFRSRGVVCEFHFLHVDDAVWKERIRRRNELVAAGKTDAYYIDANLAAKFEARFEMPAADEIDVWAESAE